MSDVQLSSLVDVENVQPRRASLKSCWRYVEVYIDVMSESRKSRLAVPKKFQPDARVQSQSPNYLRSKVNLTSTTTTENINKRKHGDYFTSRRRDLDRPTAKIQKRHPDTRTWAQTHTTNDSPLCHRRLIIHRPQEIRPLDRAPSWPISAFSRRLGRGANPSFIRRHVPLRTHATHPICPPRPAKLRGRKQKDPPPTPSRRSSLRMREPREQVGGYGDRVRQLCYWKGGRDGPAEGWDGV